MLARVRNPSTRTVQVRLRFQRRWAVAVAVTMVAAFALTLVSTAGAQSYIYGGQRNRAPNDGGVAAAPAHNHTYNGLWSGRKAGGRSEVGKPPPGGSRHFDKWCVGNCFN